MLIFVPGYPAKKKLKMEQGKSTFRAFRVEEQEGRFTGSVQEMEFRSPGDNELLVKVHYSSLNYKDALSASGNRGVTRRYPHTPGIDAAGIIVESTSEDFTAGEKVIVTSYDLGMNTDGGFAGYIQVPSDWAVKLPEKLTLKEAMIYGTAGLTAGISVSRLTEQVKPEAGKIAVSGATGGVGALSVAILNKLGYEVVAITGKEVEREYLKQLGATEVVLRSEVEDLLRRPLLKSVYAGAIDTVGGVILENIIKSTGVRGVVTCCGNVASPEIALTVYPFILRGVSLVGIATQDYPMKHRKIVWNKLADEWKPGQLHDTFQEIELEEVQRRIELMLEGKLKRRTVLTLTE